MYDDKMLLNIKITKTSDIKCDCMISLQSIDSMFSAVYFHSIAPVRGAPVSDLFSLDRNEIFSKIFTDISLWSVLKFGYRYPLVSFYYDIQILWSNYGAYFIVQWHQLIDTL